MNPSITPANSRSPQLKRLAADITAQVIAALSEGVRPWQQPWDSGLVSSDGSGRPLRHTGEGYAGINVLILWLTAFQQGYRSSSWMTYRQARVYGGQVRKGERGTVVVYADRFRKTVRDAESGEAVERLIPFLKTYTVFNSEQIEGLPEQFRPAPLPALSPAQELERVAAVEAFFAASGAVIRHGGEVPCYIPALDEIRLPAPGAFGSMGQYYATLAHELIHWTRAPGRLNRDFGRKRWELKTQRISTTSLTTLFHSEPSPRAIRFVPQVLLTKYGWPSQEAGKRYPLTEMSFRQTIQGLSPSDRGFMVKIDRIERKILISFDALRVAPRHTEWLQQVQRRVGIGELAPQPYWGFDDLAHKAGTKLLNCFYVQAAVRQEGGTEFYCYQKIFMLEKFKFKGLLKAIETAHMLIDFDARTGHNHGTKFRLRQNYLPALYEKVTVVVDSSELPDQLKIAA